MTANRISPTRSWRLHNGVPYPMCRGYRRILIAVVGITLLGAAQPVSEGGTGNPSTNQSDKSTTQDAEIAAHLGRISSALETQNNNRDSDANENAERERRDLTAHDAMALWARALFWATGALAILPAVALVRTYIT